MADAQLKSHPNDARLLTLKGIALTKLDRPDSAEQSFVAALQLQPDYVPALAGASEMEYKTGSDAALHHVDRLLALRPQDETAHAMRAVIAWRRRDCPTATQQFRLASQVISSQPEALRQFGTCLALTNHPDDAVQPFTRILQLNPDDTRALTDLANAEILAGHPAEALRVLGPKLGAPNPGPDILATAADAYEKAGDTPHAVATLRQAILEDPKRESLYLAFASLCFDHKAFSVGADMVSAGLSQLPHSAKLYMARGIFYAQMAEYAKADADFENAQMLDPQGSSGLGAKALSQFQAGLLDAAIVTLHSGLAAHPHDAYLHYLTAEILLRKGARPGSPEFAEAVSSAQTAVRLDSSMNLARDVLSRLDLASGNPQGAIEQCRAALRNDPSDQMAIYRLLRALKASGDASQSEIAALSTRLAEVRLQEQSREEAAGRFRLSEEK
jgi:Flp pilus assembly protein TadD